MKVNQIFKVIGSSLIVFFSFCDLSLAGTITRVSNPVEIIPSTNPKGITLFKVRDSGGEAAIAITPKDTPTPPTIGIQKSFNAVAPKGAKQIPIDIQFEVLDNSAAGNNVTRHSISEVVSNLTNRPWTDYHFQLGFGTGDNFQLSGEKDFLDLGYTKPDPPAKPPESTIFTRYQFLNDGNELFFDRGLVPVQNDVGFNINIDVPDSNDIPVQAKLLDGNGYIFTLRQFPTCDGLPSPRRNSQNAATCSICSPCLIPEPTSTLSLLAFGTLGAAFTLKRHKKQNKKTIKVV
jgi:hypothetical protein